MSFPLPALTNDGLPIANVGRWAEHKYRLVGYYASVFASRMKKNGTIEHTLIYSQDQGEQGLEVSNDFFLHHQLSRLI